MTASDSMTVGELSAVDPESFRRAMSSFASGVNIVTVRDEHDVPHGMTATAFCSVSVDPPQVLICIANDTRTHEMISMSESFGVSILSRELTEVSEHCARPGADKRLPDEWLVPTGPSRSPVVVGTLAHVDCVVEERCDAGSHTVYIGRVRGIHFDRADEPLVYFRGSYRRLGPPDQR